MKLKDIASQLANRINQPHVIEVSLRQVYAKGFVDGTKKSPWISVKDQLPPNMQRVLVRSEYEGESLFEVAFIMNGKWMCHNPTPTHWMPIPELN